MPSLVLLTIPGYIPETCATIGVALFGRHICDLKTWPSTEKLPGIPFVLRYIFRYRRHGTIISSVYAYIRPPSQFLGEVLALLKREAS